MKQIFLKYKISCEHHIKEKKEKRKKKLYTSENHTAVLQAKMYYHYGSRGKTSFNFASAIVVAT